MRKVCVLFGAGADAPFKIGTGGAFVRSVLGISASGCDISEMNAAIKDHYKKIVLNDDPWYPAYSLKPWKEDALVKASLRRKNLDLGKKVSDKDFKFEYDTITGNPVKKSILIDKYPSYMGLIDSKFTTLIAPSILGQEKFWQVVSCYCRAYLTIVQQILGRNDFDAFLNPTKDLICEIRRASEKAVKEDVYYSVIQRLSSSIDISVVTTNYTYYCEQLSGLSENEIAYIHGRIGLFESPRDLCVYDVEHDDIGDQIVFPYLFIQSGLKPIVEQHQIKEYTKLVKFMDESEKIIILGYNLNYDDNHINSIIRSGVTSGKEVVYLSFDDGKMNCMKRKDVIEKLKLDDSVTNLKCCAITDKNAQRVFEEELVK